MDERNPENSMLYFPYGARLVANSQAKQDPIR